MHHAQTLPIKKEASQQGLRMPDFFILGSAKCGTTTLYKYLCRHPEVFMSTPKEMSFFSKDEIYGRGMSWYAELFVDAAPHQLCGEASTTYTRWPKYENTMERLAAAQPQARLIYLVRDPVDRLFSFYAHRMRQTVTTTFESFLATTPEAIDTGNYMTQIKQCLQHFPQEQMLVLFTKDLQEKPRETLRTASQFLGLGEDHDFLAAGPIRANQGGGKYFAASSLTRSIRSFKRFAPLSAMLKFVPAPVRKTAYEWLANGPVGRKLRRQHQNNLSEITPELRHDILDMYREEIEQLEEFTGRSLPDWKESTASTDDSPA